MQLIQHLANKSRKSILKLLAGSPKTVSEIIESTEMKQANVSNHLAKLRQDGIVVAAINAQQRIYSLASEQILHDLVKLDPEFLESQNSIEAITKEHQNALYDHATNGNEAKTLGFVQLIWHNGISLQSIYKDLINPVMVRIGTEWEQGVLSISKEHIATAIILRTMAKLVSDHPRAPLKNQTILLGCIAGNYHELGLRMISDLCWIQGFETKFMGANVPTEEFIQETSDSQPTAIMISVAQSDQLPSLRQLINGLKRTSAAPILVGGLGVVRAEAQCLEFGATHIVQNFDQLDGFLTSLNQGLASEESELA